MSEEKRPEWMSSISGIVDPEEYLLGRKIDKTFELSQQEKAERARKARADRIASGNLKLAGDPFLELERRKQELKYEIISNPIKLRLFRERLLREEREEADKSKLSAGKQNEPSTSKNIVTSSSSSTSQRRTRHRSRSRSRTRSRSSATSSSSSSPRRSSRSHHQRKHRHKRDSGESSSRRRRSPRRSRSRSRSPRRSHADHRHRTHDRRDDRSHRRSRSKDSYRRRDSDSRYSKSKR